MKGLREFPEPLGKLRQLPYDDICHLAHDLDLAPDTPFHRRRERNEQVLRTGRVILDNPGICGAHLDPMDGAGRRLRNAVSRKEGCPAEGRPLQRCRECCFVLFAYYCQLIIVLQGVVFTTIRMSS